jgi:RNase P subunit RPR2
MKKTLTKKQKEQYLKNGYGTCPKCKEYGIEGGMLEVDGKVAWQDLTCLECGFSWRDEYTLSNIEVIS